MAQKLFLISKQHFEGFRESGENFFQELEMFTERAPIDEDIIQIH